MNEYYYKGRNILYGIMFAIVVLQLYSDYIDETPLKFRLIRFSLLFIFFTLVLKGYAWSKWIISIYLVLIGAGGILIGVYLIKNSNVLPENFKSGIFAGLAGGLYVAFSLTILISKNIKNYLSQQREKRVANKNN